MGSPDRQISLEGYGQDKVLEQPKHRRKRPKVLSEKQRMQLSTQIWTEQVKPLIDESREQWVAMQGTLTLDHARQDVEEMPPEIDMNRLDENLIEIVNGGKRRGLTSMDFVRPLRSDTYVATSQSPQLSAQIRRHETRTIRIIEQTFNNSEGYTKKLQRDSYRGKAKLSSKRS